jgi:hypothetical protein
MAQIMPMEVLDAGTFQRLVPRLGTDLRDQLAIEREHVRGCLPICLRIDNTTSAFNGTEIAFAPWPDRMYRRYSAHQLKTVRGWSAIPVLQFASFRLRGIAQSSHQGVKGDS